MMYSRTVVLYLLLGSVMSHLPGLFYGPGVGRSRCGSMGHAQTCCSFIVPKGPGASVARMSFGPSSTILRKYFHLQDHPQDGPGPLGCVVKILYYKDLLSASFAVLSSRVVL